MSVVAFTCLPEVLVEPDTEPTDFIEHYNTAPERSPKPDCFVWKALASENFNSLGTGDGLTERGEERFGVATPNVPALHQHRDCLCNRVLVEGNVHCARLIAEQRPQKFTLTETNSPATGLGTLGKVHHSDIANPPQFNLPSIREGSDHSVKQRS
jgi:hypothetical protein